MNQPANDAPDQPKNEPRNRNDKTIPDRDDTDTSLAAETPSSMPNADVAAGESLAPVGEATGDFTTNELPGKKEPSTGRSAFFVGAGILISRLVGLVRQRVFAHYFGASAAGDAFAAAFRIPNFLQNVFGEGALSASFIPVYSKLLAQDCKEEAAHVASAVLAMLALITSAIVLVGVLFTPYFIDVIAFGFTGETRELTIRLARVLFPGAGLLVISAWCLGVLNSHHRFFLSYTAPVAWNVAIIGSLAIYGGRVGEFPLAEMVAWGSVIGSALQFAVQLPTVFRVVHRLRPVLDFVGVHVRAVIRNFLPVFVSRGVVQISAFVDAALASLLPTGAVISLTYAQSLYTLPVSLFGMSVSAAELPAMSRALGNVEEVAEILRHRLDAGLRRIAFFIVPSSMAFLALGDVIAAVLYQTAHGKFQHANANYVWAILAGSTVGLLASTLGRLYSSTYYALRDTRTPLRYAIVRVTLTTVLGYLCAIKLPPMIGLDLKWGVAGLTASAGVAGWVEFALLRRTLNRRIGRTGLPFSYVVQLWAAAAAGAAAAWGCKLISPTHRPIPLAVIVLGAYGVVYFGVTSAFGLPEARVLIGRVLRILKLRH
jgi:putative peptidoglycan lipid II flippase